MLRHYLRLSLKVLLRRPFFTFVSIFGISFTLLVLVVMTALYDHTFGPGKPETHQARMLGFRSAFFEGPDNRSTNNGAGFRLLDGYARNLPGVERLTIFLPINTQTLYINGQRVQRDMKLTDAEFWQVLDFDFIEGAPYTAADVVDGRQVAVINRSTRTRLFGDASALGQTIPVGDWRLRVVGVVEDVSMFRIQPYSDIWAPYTVQTSQVWRTELLGGFQALALAENEAALPGIREEFDRRLTQVDFGDRSDDFNRVVAPFETEFESFARGGPFSERGNPESQAWTLIVFFAVVAALFITLPTVNLINLNVSRILERSSEIGVRKAFGAPARTLVGQFIVENVLLTLVGGLVGFIGSAAVLRAINQSGVFQYSQLALNPRVFAYGLALALAFGLISGVYPAWRMARLHPVDALRGGVSR
jgi:putative ABC transport system permease protein